jgi:hypothetical protein
MGIVIAIAISIPCYLVGVRAQACAFVWVWAQGMVYAIAISVPCALVGANAHNQNRGWGGVGAGEDPTLTELTNVPSIRNRT